MSMMESSRDAWWSTIILVMFLVGAGSSAAGNPEGPTREEVLSAARDIMTAIPLCALITKSDSGYPNVRMMDPFEPDKDMVIWLATNSSSRKVQEIREDSHVALYYSDPAGPGYVTVKGRARLVDDPKETRRRWKKEWSEFYLPDRSNYLLIEVRPSTIEVVSYRHGIVSESEDWSVPLVSFDEESDSSRD